MELQIDVQRLVQRHGEIQRAMRRPGGIRITAERELQAIREQLKNFPDALESLQCESHQPEDHVRARGHVPDGAGSPHGSAPHG